MEYLTTSQVIDAVRSIENRHFGWKAIAPDRSETTITTWKQDGRCIVMQIMEAGTWDVLTYRPIFRDQLLTGVMIKSFCDDQNKLRWQQIKKLKPRFLNEVKK